LNSISHALISHYTVTAAEYLWEQIFWQYITWQAKSYVKCGRNCRQRNSEPTSS